MTFSFNLIDQPWIPVVRSNGKPDEVGLRELLLEAHNLRAVAGATPLLNAALMPVVLALLHRVFGPANRSQWKALWDAGAFPQEQLNQYFTAWYERFDLFHPEYPFFQVRDERLSPKSALYLAETIANSETLFDHRVEDNVAPLAPAQAALTLLAAQFFRLGGGITGTQTPNLIDGLHARGILFFANGKTLFETFMLNLVPYPSERPVPYTEKDKPCWEHDDPFQGRKPGKEILALAPKGHLDYLTWQTFHIQLFPELDDSGNVVVPLATVIPVARPDDNVRNPFKRYSRKSNEDSWQFLYFNSEKSLWRDYHSLLPTALSNVRPPFVVEWLSQLAEDEVLEGSPELQLTAVGMLADQAKPKFYRQEQMPLPVVVLQNADAVLQITKAIEDAEGAAKALLEALNTLAKHVLMRGGDRAPDSKDYRALVKQWNSLSLYWERLEPVFWEFLEIFSRDQTDALDHWSQVLEQTATNALDDAARSGGTSAPALKGQVVAERQLRYRLKKLFS